MRSNKWPFLAALLVEVLIFHRRVLFGGDLFPWDFRGVHLPLETFVADSFRRGEFPLWDPYTYCGNPIYANIQTALFYPPVLVATLLSIAFGASSLGWLLGAAMVAQIFFAGVCTFFLVRRLGASNEAAWIAGTMYQLGCFFASQAEHMGAVHGASWLPLIWWCVIELRDGLRWRWLALLAAALSMTVLAGLPQVAVAAFGSAMALAVCFVDGRLVVRVLAGWAWALALAAVQVLPTIELTRNSVAKYRAEWLKSGGGIKLGALASLIVPDYWNVFHLDKFHGPSDLTFLYLYSSIAGLVLALIGITRNTRFGWLLLGATIWMLGDSTPIGNAIFLALPVSIRIGIHPEFTLCVFSLAIAVLAGLGADRFPRLRVPAGIVIAAELIFVSSGRPMNSAPPDPRPVATIEQLRQLSATGSPPWRFDMMTGVSFEWSSTAPIVGVPTANGCDPMAPERTIQMRLSFSPGARWGTCYQVVNPESQVLKLANVRYLLGADGKIREVDGTLPRYFFVENVVGARNLADSAAKLHAEDFDPRRTAIVEGVDGVEQVAPAGTLALPHIHAGGPAFLVIADSYYPGWQATIDGQPTPIYPTDAAFRGIRIPAGDHLLEMHFHPRFLWLGAVISGIALIAACWAGARVKQ